MNDYVEAVLRDRIKDTKFKYIVCWYEGTVNEWHLLDTDEKLDEFLKKKKTEDPAVGLLIAHNVQVWNGNE